MLIDRYTANTLRHASQAEREVMAAELSLEIANMVGSGDVRMIDAAKALAVLSGDAGLIALAMSSRLNGGVFSQALGELMVERMNAIGKERK